MAGWAPLNVIRPQVAAAKAFPPVASAQAPAASGRRPKPYATAQAATPQPKAPGLPGWAWIAGGVALGALSGLLITHLFPKIVQVDRPVEKIVDRPVDVVRVIEKPVEVVRTVEKRVEVPALLTADQLEALDFVKRRDDALKRETGIGRTAMVPVFEKKVRVQVYSQASNSAVSESSIRARIESTLRRNGFLVIPESDKESFCNTTIVASLDCLDRKNNEQITGSVGLSVSQYGIFAGGGMQKQAWVTMSKYGISIQYGTSNFFKIPSLFDDLALEASNDLHKAGQLPYER